MFRLLAAVALATLTLCASPGAADIACRMAQARSSDGAVFLHSSAWGCRTAAHPIVLSVQGGVRDYEFEVEAFPAKVLVSDTGRTVVMTDYEANGDGSLLVYRDGRRLGTWTFAELLGARHSVVTRAQRLRVTVEGVRLKLTSARGTELLDEHLGLFGPRVTSD